jgi:hypothetical protein
MSEIKIGHLGFWHKTKEYNQEGSYTMDNTKNHLEQNCVIIGIDTNFFIINRITKVIVYSFKSFKEFILFVANNNIKDGNTFIRYIIHADTKKLLIEE